MGKIADMLLKGFYGAGNILDTPGSMVRDALALQNPLDQLATPWSSENRVTGRDLARKWGLASEQDTAANMAGGLGLEMALDPLTWLGAGGVVRAMRGASTASKAARPAAAASKAAGASRGAVAASYGAPVAGLGLMAANEDQDPTLNYLAAAMMAAPLAYGMVKGVRGLGKGKQAAQQAPVAPTAKSLASAAGATAIKRSKPSATMRSLQKSGAIRGKVLHQGAGQTSNPDRAMLDSLSSDVIHYDPAHSPETAGLLGKADRDTIVTPYVVNVVPPDLRPNVYRDAARSLADDGNVFISARGRADIAQELKPSWKEFGDGYLVPNAKAEGGYTFQRGYTAQELADEARQYFGEVQIVSKSGKAPMIRASKPIKESAAPPPSRPSQPAPSTWYDIGHGTSDASDAFIVSGGRVVKAPVTEMPSGQRAVHEDLFSTSEIESAVAKGRIDHTAKRISLTSTRQGPSEARRMERVVDQLKKQYPDYEIYSFDDYFRSLNRLDDPKRPVRLLSAGGPLAALLGYRAARTPQAQEQQ